MHPDRMLAAIFALLRSINQESTVTGSVRNFERVQEFFLLRKVLVARLSECNANLPM